MERFSTLYGTNQYGSYERLGTSQKMADFLTRKIGAANALDVIEEVEKTLKAFEALPGFDQEPRNLRPMAIRYAPMYLYKKPNMPDNMKEFCALCVNGHEGREERYTTFTHTTVFPFDLMHKSGEYNYLDQIFGTYLLTVKELAASRDAVAKGKSSPIDFDKLPSKVLPVMRRTDMLPVLKAAEAVYTGKSVVIRLEEGYSFHVRAWDLLTQIYSLLYPKLATETGFAMYQKVEDIPDLCRNTGIRVFVEPAGVALEKLAEQDLVILDLNDPATITPPQNAELLAALQTWYRMGWNVRQKAMELTFAGVESIRNTEMFIQLTGEYIQAVREKDEWLAAAPKNVETMAEVAAYLTKGTFLKKLPDAVEIRKTCASKMLRPGVTIEMLNADSAVQQFFATDGTREKKLADVYCQVGSILGGVDPKVLREKTAAKQDALTAGKYTGVVTELKQQMASDKEAHAAEVAKLNSDHDTAMTQAKEAHNQQMVALTQKCGQQIDELKQAHEAKVAGMTQQHAEEVTTLTTARDTAERNLANAQNQILADQQAHAAAMEEARKAQAQAVFNAKATLREELEAQHQQEKNQLVAHYSAEKRNLENTYQTQLDQERQNAAAAQRTAAALQRRVDALSAAAAGADGLDVNIYEDIDDTDTGTNTGKGRTGGGKFDKDKGEKKNNALIMGIAIGAVVGLILGIVIMLGVNALTRDPEETIPTTDPIVTTTAPVETTEPVETTLPVETTVPEETTVPVETTQPEETTEPTEPGEVAKPEIDWTTVPATTGLAAVETDETNVGNLLNDVVLGQDMKAVAIVTVEETGFMDANGVRVRPGEYAVLLEKTGLEAEAQTDAEVRKLEDTADLILESTHYRLVVVGEAKMQEAALKLFALAVPAEDPEVSLSMVLADESVLKMDKLLDEVITEEPWWSVVTDVTVEENALLSGKNVFSSRLVPVAAINCGLNSTIYIYDYSAEADKVDDFLASQEKHSRTAAAVDALVAVVHQIAQG